MPGFALGSFIGSTGLGVLMAQVFANDLADTEVLLELVSP
jgi:hypothetical protein